MAMKKILTAARLREVLHYDPDTGVFTWIATMNGSTKAGQVAGNTQRLRPGYTRRRICIDYVEHKANRLAWLYMTDEWPDGLVDHRNTDPMDNRWSNLRIATPSENQWNVGLRSNNTSGYTGVVYNKQRKKWQASIHQMIGRFDTPEEAHEAYKRAVLALAGEFAYGQGI